MKIIQRDPVHLLALIVATASTLGLVLSGSVYPDDGLTIAFVPNDAVNLLAGVPLVLFLPRGLKRSTNAANALVGELLMPGAFAYHMYSSLTYVLALWPPSIPASSPNPAASSAVFILQLSSAALSATYLVRSVLSIAGPGIEATSCVRDGVAGCWRDLAPAIFGGSVLMLWGALFLSRAVMMLSKAAHPDRTNRAEWAVCASDVVIGPLWVCCGWHLCRRTSIGYVVGLAALFQASALFVALEVLLVARPFLVREAPEVSSSDIVVVGLMGLTVIYPFVRLLQFTVTKEPVSTSKAE